MATVTHVIRSHYDPADRDKLECATSRRGVGSDIDPWRIESSFSAQPRIRAAPTFVPASFEWGLPSHTSTSASEKPPDRPSVSTAEWYRSLRLTAQVPSSSTTPPRSSSAPAPTGSEGTEAQRRATEPPRERVTKNDWFIRRALRSEPTTAPSSPAPSLADLLARDPPPLPSERRYIPPVWLHIGPSNRGFGMLQRSGWREGEGLGARVFRQGDADERVSSSIRVPKGMPDIRMTPGLIVLTLSDSEASEDVPEDDNVIQESVQSQTTTEGAPSTTQRSLLTPLPIILKADRLGIGLKAKTEGPYKQSKKRVTHGAAALAAHIRSAEDMRRKKASLGKGKRRFDKLHRREEDMRKSMLAYLKE